MKYPREDILRHLWNKKYLNTENLKTIEGEELTILEFGNLQRFSGPDFRNSEIIINGNKIFGDIEFHRTIKEWKSHNHEKDKNYNNVVLHVIFENPKEKNLITNEANKKVSTLAIKNYLKKNLNEIIEELQILEFKSTNKAILCATKNDKITSDDLINAVNLYFEKRIENKKERIKNNFKALKDDKKWEQLFFEELFEALGYSNNKNPMREIAKTFRIDLFYRLFRDYNLSPISVEALFFQISGFLINENFANASSRIKSHELRQAASEIILEIKKYFDLKLPNLKWITSPNRPSNSPQIRVLAGSKYVYQIVTGNMFNEIVKLFSNPITNSKNKFELLFEMFLLPGDEFWENHFTIDKETELSHQIIGKEKILDILMNVIIPLMKFYGEENCNEIICENSNLISREIPKSGINSIITKMSKQLIKEKITLKYSWQQQGILELYKNYCYFEKCSMCEIGKKI